MNPLAATETEEFFLATLIHCPEEIPVVAALVKPGDFTLQRNEDIYAALLDMVAKGILVAEDTVATHLAAQGKTVKDGWLDTIISLSMLSGTWANPLAEARARMIQDAALRRAMRHDALGIIDALGDATKPIDEIAGLAQRAALRASERRGGDGPMQLDALLPQAFEALEKMSKGEITGLKTGFTDLDIFTGGFQKSDLVILGGRPGMGKTVLAVNIAAHVSIDNHLPVLFCELEMGRIQIVNRILFSRAGVNGRLLRTGKLPQREFPKLQTAVAPMRGAPFFLDGTTGLTPLQLLSMARQIKIKHGLSLIVVDNIQIMKGDGKYGGNKRLEIGDISNNLKRIAKELDCTLLAISHLSRECERRGDPEPTLSDLKETGDIEQDADVVMLLYREEVYKDVPPEEKGKTKVIFAKFREGETVAKLLRFVPEHNLFINWTGRTEDPSAQRRDWSINVEDLQ